LKLDTKYYSGDEIGEAAEKRVGGDVKCVLGVGGNETERHHFEDVHVVGSRLLRQILKNRIDGHGID
jgi:hypothetical protein